MNPFTYSQTTEAQDAVEQIARERAAKFIAGGTNLIDLMKVYVETPAHLVDITHLPLTQIEELDDARMRIGALVSNTNVAEHPIIRERYPAISEAILSGATAQLRNMATVGGNLLQRTRCYYFYDTTMPCNKRVSGSGCAAIDGFNKIHAILGTSEHCIATFPSDMCVALATLDAVVRVEGPTGERLIPFADFHRLPGDTPHIDNNLGRDELITAIDLPASPLAAKSHYLKVRERTSYAFALVSVATALDIQGGTIREARVAMGGVAHKPWRAVEAEQILVGAPATEATYRRAAEETMHNAQAYKHNAFKIELAKRSIVRALRTVAEKTGREIV